MGAGGEDEVRWLELAGLATARVRHDPSSWYPVPQNFWARATRNGCNAGAQVLSEHRGAIGVAMGGQQGEGAWADWDKPQREGLL